MLKVEYSNNSIQKIVSSDFSIPFDYDGFGFYVNENDNKVKLDVENISDTYTGKYRDLNFSYSFAEYDDYLAVNLRIENNGDDFVGKITFNTGIDSYMTHYPQWNEKFFPTLLRCEKTHLWGYYMNTMENSLAIATSDSVSSYDILYNIFYEEGYPHNGHRILGTELVLFCDMIGRAHV